LGKGVGRGGKSKGESYVIVCSRTLAVINQIDGHFSQAIAAVTSSSASGQNTQCCHTVGWGSRKQCFSHPNWLRALLRVMMTAVGISREIMVGFLVGLLY